MTAMRELALSAQVLFFSGKGGVGKTTLASATALAAARQGKRVLVVSTDPAHNLGHLWQREVGQEPVQLWSPGDLPAASPLPRAGRGEVQGVELDAAALAAAHLDSVAQTLRGFVADSMRGHLDDYIDLVRQAPGTHDSALSQTIAELCVKQRGDYDLVIFDTAPTGHTARLMHMPRMLSRYSEALLTRRKRAQDFADVATALGQDNRDRERDDRIVDILKGRQQLFEDFHALMVDPRKVAFVLVLTAERMPVLETIDFAGELARLSIEVGATVVNRRTPISDVELLQQRRLLEDEYTSQLRQQLPDIALVEVPQLVGEPTGVEALTEVGDWLI